MIDLAELRSLRARKNVSQNALSELLSIASYSAKERGELNFSLSDVLSIALFYKLTVEEFNKIFLQGRLKNGY